MQVNHDRQKSKGLRKKIVSLKISGYAIVTDKTFFVRFMAGTGEAKLGKTFLYDKRLFVKLY